ncbi:type VI secretion system secreted protein VgrG [Buttiauxella sp. JUb87]|uniref:type VI secretion system Vgr family protein n=1 Tax=Buttiauxella sp. JUb87 TaxID=2485129 RepID=UPI00106238E3|nr:type VI secretion system tip protein TssI/VgrG [Buttiauxella sp. JUb87]TDN51767.1 type VI secretion system secreted protein VgrG [Buttiauxella sp. JUb87]
MSLKGLRFTLEVEGLEPDTFAVVSFRLLQHNSAAFVLDADVASKSFRQTADPLLEKNVTLTLWQGQKVLRHVSGIIATFGMSEHNGWQMQYTLRIHPPLWRCGLRQNFRIFQQQDIQTITATLLAENGVTNWTSVFYESHPAREFCAQYGESDFAFLSRLWAEEGIFFFDDVSPDGVQRLMLTDDVTGLRRMQDAFPFNPNVSTGTTTEHISVFRHEAGIAPSSVTSLDYTFKMPDWPGVYRHKAQSLNGQRTQYEVLDYPGRFKDEQHGEDFTRYKLDAWRNQAETATGTSNSPALSPGVRFPLAGHPIKSHNRQWQVISSAMTGEQPQALHGSRGEGTTLTNRFVAIPGDRTWRPNRPQKPKVDGPQSAVVTGPPGEEIFCDEHGRVRVKFRWDRYHGETEDSSCWIRVSQAWAGAGFGHLAIPRVGQEVIVDFLNGDPDQPIVMGRTYHEDNRSPGSLPGTKTQMTLRSKTYQGSGFNELKFDDATANEQVYLHAQKNMDTEVLNNRTTDVKVNHTETIGNNQSITVGLGQTVKVGKENAGGHDQNITVAHDRSITVHNDQTLKVTRDHTVNTGRDDALYVANDRKVTVEGSQAHKTTKDHLSLVEGNHSLEVKGDLAQKVAGALGTDAQGDIVLQSNTKITLKMGSSFIVIHPGGVDISGLKINLNSGGSPGTPVQTQLPAVLSALADEDDNSPNEPEDEDESDQYNIQFHFANDDDTPYRHTRYIAKFSDGTQQEGVTDNEGNTKNFNTEDQAQVIEVRLLSQNIDMILGGVHE